MPILHTDRSRLVALGALTLASVGCAASDPGTAPAAQSSSRQCFLPSQVNGFNAIDRDTVDVTVGVNDIYRLEIGGACPDVDWSLKIGIRSTGGGSWICQGRDAELIVPSPIGTRQCPVLSVRKLTDEEISAD